MKPKRERSGRRASERPKRGTSHEATDADLSELFADTDVSDLIPSDTGLFDGLKTFEELIEPSSESEQNLRRGKTMKRPTSQASPQPAPEKKGTGSICAQHPSGRSGKLNLSPFSPADSIEAFAETVADRVAERIADRLAGLAGPSAPQPAAGETIGWPASRLTVTEPEAAALLGMRRHQLRDRRLKGEISCCSPRFARPVLYRRENLLDFINRAGQTESEPKLHEPIERAPNDSA